MRLLGAGADLGTVARLCRRGGQLGGRPGLRRGFLLRGLRGALRGRFGHLRFGRLRLDADRLQPGGGGDQRDGAAVGLAPDRVLPSGLDLGDEAAREQAGDDLLRGSPAEARRQREGDVAGALRGGAEDQALGVAELHGVVSSVVARTARASYHPEPRVPSGRGGAGAQCIAAAGPATTHALLGAIIKRKLDHMIAICAVLAVAAGG